MREKNRQLNFLFRKDTSFCCFLLCIVFTCCQQTAPVSLPDLYHAGIQAGIQGELTTAANFFRQALDIAPDNGPSEVCLAITSDVDKTKITKETAVLLFQAIHAQNGNDLPRKIQFLTQAAELAPEYKLIYNERGIAYFELGMYDLAIEDRDRALELDPTYAAAYYNKALACEKALRPLEAVAAYQQFVRYADPQLGRHIGYARARIAQLSAGKN